MNKGIHDFSIDKIKKINSLIEKEKEDTTITPHRLSKLEEAKMLSLVFSNNINNEGRYRLPW